MSCRRDGSGQTASTIWSPPLARRSKRRKEVATLAGIFPKKFWERNDPGWKERDMASHPSRSCPRFTSASPIFPAPRAWCARWHAKRAHPCKTATSTPLLIMFHADTRIVHLMVRARRVTDADFNYYHEEERARAEGWMTDPGDVGEAGGSFTRVAATISG